MSETGTHIDSDGHVFVRGTFVGSILQGPDGRHQTTSDEGLTFGPFYDASEEGRAAALAALLDHAKGEWPHLWEETTKNNLGPFSARVFTRGPYPKAHGKAITLLFVQIIHDEGTVVLPSEHMRSATLFDGTLMLADDAVDVSEKTLGRSHQSVMSEGALWIP